MSDQARQPGTPGGVPGLAGFGAVDMTLYNAMLRNGITSVEALQGQDLPGWIDPERYARSGWEYFLEIRTIGPVKVLHLVNWLRDVGIELSWFADWDDKSGNWDALQGKRRAVPPAQGGEGK